MIKSLQRLQLLIGVADHLLEQKKRMGQINELAAVLVAILIERELSQIHLEMCVEK